MDRGCGVGIASAVAKTEQTYASYRSVLRATFTKPFGVRTALWAVMIVCGIPLHLSAIVLALTTLVVLGCGMRLRFW